MTDRSAQAYEAIRDSWDFWLNEHSALTLPQLISEAVSGWWDAWLTLHDVSVPDRIETAVEHAVDDWLRRNTDELLSWITAEVARRMPPPEPPAGGPGRPGQRETPAGEIGADPDGRQQLEGLDAITGAPSAHQEDGR